MWTAGYHTNILNNYNELVGIVIIIFHSLKFNNERSDFTTLFIRKVVINNTIDSIADEFELPPTITESSYQQIFLVDHSNFSPFFGSR